MFSFGKLVSLLHLPLFPFHSAGMDIKYKSLKQWYEQDLFLA